MPVASRTALTAATTSPRASAATASGGSWKEFDDMARPRTDLRTAYGTEIGRAHSELQSLMRISYAVFCLKKKKIHIQTNTNPPQSCEPNTARNQHIQEK